MQERKELNETKGREGKLGVASLTREVAEILATLRFMSFAVGYG